MKVIYKYPVHAPGHNKIQMPKGYMILKLGYDPNNILCIWALVNTDNEKEDVFISMVGTGWPLDFDSVKAQYLDTINDGPYVWHGFKVEENEK